MIFGIGTDIFKLSRLESIAGNLQDPFFRKAFTKREQEQASERPVPLQYYFTRFAGKEAVFKAICKCGCDFVPGDIEILDPEDGSPVVSINGNTAEVMRNFTGSEITIHVSLSYDTDYAIAFALAETKE